MAANYWSSTQRRFWLFTRDSLADTREEHAAQDRGILQQHTLPDNRLINLYIKECINKIAKRLIIRQQVFATAMVYIHRYLLSTPIQTVNIYLLVSTAFYLASKTEESPHHIRLVITEARSLWPEFIPGDVARIGEMEFSLISELRSQLIIWHPYRTLKDLEENSALGITTDEVRLAWSIINDSYMTDLPLTCPPHVTALMAIFLAVIVQPSKVQLGLPSLTQSQPLSRNTLPPSSLPSAFDSLGGRSGMADNLMHTLGNLSSSQPSSMPSSSQPPSMPSSQGSKDSNGASGERTAGAAKAEKIQRMMRFLAESEVDLKQMIEATQELFSLYELWEGYSERAVREALSRIIKVRGLDK
jgi:cyclin C